MQCNHFFVIAFVSGPVSVKERRSSTGAQMKSGPNNNSIPACRDPDRFGPLVDAVASGPVSNEDRRVVEVHLRECRACQEQYRETLELAIKFRTVYPKPVSSESISPVEKMVYARIRRYLILKALVGGTVAAGVALAFLLALSVERQVGVEEEVVYTEKATDMNPDTVVPSSAKVEEEVGPEQPVNAGHSAGEGAARSAPIERGLGSDLRI